MSASTFTTATATWLTPRKRPAEEDNGVGMDSDTRERLFTLFFSTKGKSGTGLGLFISRKIVSQHGGRIQVDSTTGQGSRFTVSVPLLSPTSIPEAAA